MPDLVFRAVNLRHEKADIRVCRPSRWGNPWRVVKAGRDLWSVAWRGCVSRRMSRFEANDTAVREYREWIRQRPELVTALRMELNELGAKAGWTYRDHPEEITLGCWCKPLPCHADVLCELLDAALNREANR